MGKVYEIQQLEFEYAKQLERYEGLSKVVANLQSRQKERGRSLNRLWEENKKLKKEIVILQKYCGKLTYDISRLQLENRIKVTSEQFGSNNILLKNVVEQLIKDTGHYLEMEVLHKKQSLTIIGKEIKK